jgi:hypothetical protein
LFVESKPRAPVVRRVDIAGIRPPRTNEFRHRVERTGAAPRSKPSKIVDAEPVYGGQCDTPAFPILPWIERAVFGAACFEPASIASQRTLRQTNCTDVPNAGQRAGGGKWKSMEKSEVPLAGRGNPRTSKERPDSMLMGAGKGSRRLGWLRYVMRSRSIELVVKIVPLEAKSDDFAYWQLQPPQERLAALEEIRRAVHGEELDLPIAKVVRVVNLEEPGM